MHFSRMRTGRSLTVCRSLLPRGRYAPGGGWCLFRGVSTPGRGVCACWDTSPPREQNDKQVQKYYLGHNFVVTGKKIVGVLSEITTTMHKFKFPIGGD